MKKLLSVLLTIILVISVVPMGAFTFTASAETSTYGYYTYSVYNNEATIESVSTDISGDIEIPSAFGSFTVTGINYHAFYNCTKLTSITIPDSVEIIAYEAFYGCTDLIRVNIGNGVTTISIRAFSSCTSLAEIIAGENNSAFNSIDGVLFDKNITTLIRYPQGKTNSSYEIPSSVLTIQEAAFDDCNYLISITIPKSDISIDTGRLDWDSLTEINVDENNDNYCSIDGVLFDKNVTTLIQYPTGKTNALYVIPDGVTNISNCAFRFCNSLQNIAMPSSVTTIGAAAFEYSTNLTVVWYRGSKTEKENITIDSQNSYLTSATWYYNSCIESESHTYDNVCDADCNVCGFIRDNIHAYSSSNICTECGYNKIFDYISYTITDNTVIITDCDTAISGKYVIPSTIEGYDVTGIGDNAFDNCTNITDIILPDAVVNIGQEAFYGCTGLKNITVPVSVTSIGDNAFYNCAKLASVYYMGTDEDMAYYLYVAGYIGTNNTYLTNATWYYESCIGSAAHTYDNACDTTCNVCDAVRAVPDHVYDNACDTVCNECSLIRTVPDHVYDNACDTACNECGMARTVPDHVYDDVCDADCNECGVMRDEIHTFSEENVCTVCGYNKILEYISYTYRLFIKHPPKIYSLSQQTA